MLTLLTAVVLTQSPIVLQSLVPTSGTGVEALFDGKPETGWTPEGDAEGEGVLARFEQPTEVFQVQARACKGSSPHVTAFINGHELGGVKLSDAPVAVAKTAGAVSTLFLRFDDKGPGQCVAELIFSGKKEPLDVRPPRVVNASVKASSTLEPFDAYQPGFLFDGTVDYAWVEGAKGLGLGESLTVSFEQPTTLAALELWNGFQNSNDTYVKNARAKKLTVTVDGEAPVVFPVKDAQGPQKLAFAKPVTTKTLTLTLTEGFKGTVYEDLVLSELRLWDATGPLRVRTTDLAERAAALKAQVKTTPLEPFVDASFHEVCNDVARVQSKFRSNHTFVVYRKESLNMGSLEEVIDGTWVVRDAKTIELFARRHRTEASWNPYGDGDGSREATGITGGKLTVTPVGDLAPAAWEALRAKLAKGPAASAVVCATARNFEVLKARGAVLIEGRALTALVQR